MLDLRSYFFWEVLWMTTMEGLMSAGDIAARLGLSISMISYLTSIGILPCQRVTCIRYRLFSPEDLATYKRRRRALARAGKSLARWAEVSGQLTECEATSCAR